MNAKYFMRMRYLLVIDMACILSAFVASFVIRYEALVSVGPYLTYNQALLWLSLLVRLPLYRALGLYDRLWRYASMREMQRIILVGTLSSALIYGLNFYVLPVLGWRHCPSHSVVVLDWLLNIFLLGGSRFVLRLVQERMTAADVRLLKTFVENPRRVLVAGAGDTGAMVVREMQHNAGLALRPVGFVDDDPHKQKMCIHNVEVLGTCQEIPTLVKKYHVDEVIIAMPTAPGKVIRRIKDLCQEAGVSFKTMPGIYELLSGAVSLRQIREVRIEDLLRRELVATDVASIAGYLKGARVLVTGAGGSIGAELCRQIARYEPECLILLGHGENSIFYINMELRHTFPGLPTRVVITDIRDRYRLPQIMETWQPTIVFHAAAHKHVPLMERNVAEAVSNNVLGTWNMLQAASRNGVERFVLISTDKAVNPCSVMGASKRIAEMLVQDAAQHSEGVYVAVRFGNVLGSRGSVVPLFQQQIAVGGPVTVTHRDMRRYFMTIPEAVQLVLQAAILGQGGEVFVLQMGEPVRILNLAQDLIELSGLKPGRDIDIVFTGVRPGEKLCEELFNGEEQVVTTCHEKILVVTSSDISQGPPLNQHLRELENLAREADEAAILAKIQEMVPEFHSPEGIDSQDILQRHLQEEHLRPWAGTKVEQWSEGVAH